MSNRLIPTDPLTIVFPIYPEVTHLDFTGPHQVFARLPNVKLIVASVAGRPVNADGLIFSGLSSLEEIEHCEVLCIPGGFGCVAAIEDPTYLSAIRRLALSARYITSVCTGSLILGAAGLLEGRRAACHWAWREFLTLFGAIPDEGRVVRDGNIITGGGVTAGIDFALTLAAELTNLTIAQSIQLGIEYAPAPPFDCGTPDRASKEVLNLVLARNAKIAPNRRAALERAVAELGRTTQTTH